MEFCAVVQHFEGGVGQTYFTKGMELNSIIFAFTYSMFYLKGHNQHIEKVKLIV